MYINLEISVWLLVLISSYECSNPYTFSKPNPKPIGDNPGVPLILTPLIEAGKIEDAKAASQVYFNGFRGVKSYSGYFTVNKVFNSNLFFWYFPSETDEANAPVVLWLQGGPGATSLMGVFAENGPFTVMSQHGLKKRKYYWSKNHSVIYIDNPVGTGFSFTDNGYAQNETQVGEELYIALQQFFIVFPELQKNDFFVSGESYAGKYAPAIGYTIHTKNPTASLKINLKGVTLGNAFSDPEHQLDYADYLYQLGLIDSDAQKEVQQLQNQMIESIQRKDWNNASTVFDSLVLGVYSNQTYLQNVTGFVNHYNFLFPVDPSNEMDYMEKYVQRDDVRAALHVGNTTFNSSSNEVALNLKEDLMQSVASWVIELVNNYRVLVYNGQLDIIVAYPLTVNYLQNLNFSAAAEYKTAQRFQWHVDDDLAGYTKQAGNLTEVLVRNAGHLVPADQPKWAFDMISRFTRNKPFHF